MADFLAKFSNCLVGGHLRTKYKNKYVLDRIDWELNGFSINLFQDIAHWPPDFKKYKGKFIHSSRIFVKNVISKDVARVQEILKDLADLLSLCSLSRICMFSYEYPASSGLGSFWGAPGTTQYFRPLIPIERGDVVKNFIDEVWPMYQKHKKKRKLPEIIDYLVKAESTEIEFIEVRLLIIFVVLESLKDTFAKVKRIPHIKGFFRKVSSKPPNKWSALKFEEILSDMLKEVKLKKGLKQIIKHRNQMIHTGLLAKTSVKQKYQMYARCFELVQFYLMRFLNYHGPLCPYSNPNLEIKI